MLSKGFRSPRRREVASQGRPLGVCTSRQPWQQGLKDAKPQPCGERDTQRQRPGEILTKRERAGSERWRSKEATVLREHPPPLAARFVAATTSLGAPRRQASSGPGPAPTLVLPRGLTLACPPSSRSSPAPPAAAGGLWLSSPTRLGSSAPGADRGAELRARLRLGRGSRPF